MKTIETLRNALVTLRKLSIPSESKRSILLSILIDRIDDLKVTHEALRIWSEK